MIQVLPDRLVPETRVGIADLGVGRGPKGSVVTHALGSCVAVFAWHPITLVGGCLHYMLPVTSTGEEPHKFANTGIPRLLRAVARSRSDLARLRIVATGGAKMQATVSSFQIGARNVDAVHRVLEELGLRLHAHDLGGSAPRTARLDLANGRVFMSSKTGNRLL